VAGGEEGDEQEAQFLAAARGRHLILRFADTTNTNRYHTGYIAQPDFSGINACK
jgi:hypothetical protein